MRALVLVSFVFAMVVNAVAAQERPQIGEGRLFNNDYLGDGSDRWRTGSYVYSHVRAPRDYDPTSDFAFGELLEYRLRGEIIAADPSSPAPGDRPYVGALSFGVHTHFNEGPTRISLGADVVAIGPSTGLSRFQDGVHDALGMPKPVYTDTQLGDSIHLLGTVALGRTYQLNDTMSLRPFVETQVGTEDLIRVGGDVVIGGIGQEDLLLRDVTTGQLYRGTDASDAGFSYVLGADFARVAESSQAVKSSVQ